MGCKIVTITYSALWKTIQIHFLIDLTNEIPYKQLYLRQTNNISHVCEQR